MNSERNLQAQIGPVALVVATLLFGSFRPMPRLHHRAAAQPGVNESVFTWEPVDRTDTQRSIALPVRDDALLFLLPLALAPLLVLKTRRRARVPLTFRRLKLLPSANDPLPSLQA